VNARADRAIRHVVWDWNGTLLDDAPLLHQAANHALQAVGAPPITIARYRAAFRRPIRRFYEALVGRGIDDDEWLVLDDAFHVAYDRLLDRAALAPDASTALARVHEHGAEQSILSMLRHAHLERSVRNHGIAHHFVLVHGLRAIGGGHKEPHLTDHLTRLGERHPGLTAAEVLLVGDTLDDAHAAHATGVRCVLYAGGEQPETRLAAEGFPVATSLTQALDLADLDGVG
jgi:phosphoglycolate phosphatase-like HAD superfamily hydrolase